MDNLTWAGALDKIKSYIFRISTPDGHGSGFQIYNSGKRCLIATALHVVKHAFDWDEPIKIKHHLSKKLLF